MITDTDRYITPRRISVAALITAQVLIINDLLCCNNNTHPVSVGDSFGLRI